MGRQKLLLSILYLVPGSEFVGKENENTTAKDA